MIMPRLDCRLRWLSADRVSDCAEKLAERGLNAHLEGRAVQLPCLRLE